MRPLPLVPLLTTAVLVVMAAACAPPELGTEDGVTVEPTGPDLDAPDPRKGALVDTVEELDATLEAAHGALQEAANAPDVAVARAAAERAVHLLSADPDLVGDLDGDGATATPRAAPLFPGPTERLDDGEHYGDVFSRTLTAARAAGAAGGDVVDLLRDPVAGDIGVWQQDAGGVLESIRDAIEAGRLEEVEVAVAELAGEGTRALAWALAAVRSSDLEAIHAYAERGGAHLDLIRSAIDAVEIE
ncbi:MAG: hypothetical protein KY469_07015 [Actinobacteria bacterium]|nr:hypothetical protein [Actinomycetota bacterium]